MRAAVRYQLPRRFRKRGFVERLKGRCRVATDPPFSRRETLLDTFDWRLFRAGLTLSTGEGRLFLSSSATGDTLKSAEAPEALRFASDLPRGILRRRLESITKERALLALFEVDRRVSPIRVLKRSEKTVVRLEIETVRLVRAGAAEPFSRHLRLKPVRGYDKQARDLAGWLAESGFEEARDDLFAGLAETAGKHPGEYTSKLDFSLDPAMSAYDALVRICRFLVLVIRRNEEGIRRDIDVEFLHDWRVAARRTRAALGQLRKVFPKSVGRRFRNEFAQFGEMTNRLRDMDVYLRNVDGYRALMPEEKRGDIERLFEHVRSERSRELEKVRVWLESAHYKSTLAEWERFLDRPFAEAYASADSLTPVLELANRTVYARYRSVVDFGTEAAADPDDGKLHVLRIECKKLRYLLEFFSSLYPHHDVSRLIKQLKLLQDNLGRHQDISVQQSGLRAVAEDLGSARSGGDRTAVAAGALIAALEGEKQELRAALGGVFAYFASKGNRRLFERLFTAPGEGETQRSA